MKLDEILERLHSQRLYFCNDAELAKQQLERLDMVFEYNQLKPSRQEEKADLLRKMFASFGRDSYIETPFYASWGGKHVHFGEQVYANFNLTLVDDCEIHVGNRVMIAPNVVLTTGTHPVEPNLRSKQAQYNLPIHIEDNVWIGANCVVMPGVRIGENSVIGAGSIVTKDIPSNVVAYGAPCKVLREIGKKDREFYYKDFKIDLE